MMAEAAKRGEWFGRVILVRPLSFAFLTALAGLCAGTILAFLFFGVYTKRTQVAGLLVPDRGVIKVMAQQPGRGRGKPRQGRAVGQERGGALRAVLGAPSHRQPDAEQEDSSQVGVGTNAAILETVRARQESLKDEHTQQVRLTAQQHEQIARRILNLRAEVAPIDEEIATQSRARRPPPNRCADTLQDSRRAAFPVRTRLAAKAGRTARPERPPSGPATQPPGAAERTYVGAERIGATAGSKQTQAGANRAHELGTRTNRRRRRGATADAGDGAAGRTRSPRSSPSPAKTVDNHPLLTLLPANSRLEAQLYVRAARRASSKPGQKVLIRYAAYPYQKFGQCEGTVDRRIPHRPVAAGYPRPACQQRRATGRRRGPIPD